MSSELSEVMREHIETLVESLLQQPDSQNLLDKQEGQPILLDIAVKGFRCVVTKLPPEQPYEEGIRLSPRENEIARMIAKGYPNKTIANVLDISTYTVSTYIRRMFAKLQVRSRAALVAQLLRQGLIKEDVTGKLRQNSDRKLEDTIQDNRHHLLPQDKKISLVKTNIYLDTEID